MRIKSFCQPLRQVYVSESIQDCFFYRKVVMEQFSDCLLYRNVVVSMLPVSLFARKISLKSKRKSKARLAID